MSLPSMNVIFKSAAVTAIRQSARGTVGLILKDTVPATNPIVMAAPGEVPTTLTAANQAAIKLAFLGNVYAPRKVVAYILGTPGTGETILDLYGEALQYFALNRVNYIASPTADTDSACSTIVTWVQAQRAGTNKVKAVLPNTTANDEGVINYAINANVSGATTYTAEAYTPRIAGLLAGTPSDQGATFAALPDLDSCTFMTKTELETAISAGKFVIFNDGEKIKVARAVNSLTTISAGKSTAWQKIKVIETMDMISEDLTLLVEDTYIGKYPNTYANKGLVLSAVGTYLAEIAAQGLVENVVVDLDAAKIKDYIITYKGVPVEEANAMDETELKKQYTDEKVFLVATMTVVDVMEDITLNITV